MAAIVSISEFYKGEGIVITLLAKNRDGSVIASPAAQLVTMTIATSAGAPPLAEFSTTSGHIVLTDAATGEYTITLTPADLSALNEGTSYYYNIWTGQTSATRLAQTVGPFRLIKSIKPT